jgi:hypothetical protein
LSTIQAANQRLREWTKRDRETAEYKDSVGWQPCSGSAAGRHQSGTIRQRFGRKRERGVGVESVIEEGGERLRKREQSGGRRRLTSARWAMAA